VYDINALHAFRLRESKRTYESVSTLIAQGLVGIINARDTKMVMSPKAYGLVSNTHHSKTCMLKNCTNDRMSCGKRTKWTNSDAEAKKTTFPDEINHVAVCLLPAEAWVSTLMPLTFLKSATDHAVKLNDNSMLYIYIKDQTLDVLWLFSCRKFLPLSLFGYCPQKNPTT